jgi:hypothetical protein
MFHRFSTSTVQYDFDHVRITVDAGLLQKRSIASFWTLQRCAVVHLNINAQFVAHRYQVRTKRAGTQR